MSADGMATGPDLARIAQLEADFQSLCRRIAGRGAYAWESAELTDLRLQVLREEMRGQPVIERPAPMPSPTRGHITMLERMFGCPGGAL